MSVQELQVIVREWVLASTFPPSIVMVCIFLLVVRREFRWRHYNEHHWYGTLKVQAAVSMATLMFGIAMRATWVWMLLWSYTHPQFAHWRGFVERFWWVDIVAGALTLIGSLCTIRVFTPYELNLAPFYRRPWIIAAILDLVFLSVIHAGDPVVTEILWMLEPS